MGVLCADKQTHSPRWWVRGTKRRKLCVLDVRALWFAPAPGLHRSSPWVGSEQSHLGVYPTCMCYIEIMDCESQCCNRGTGATVYVHVNKWWNKCHFYVVQPMLLTHICVLGAFTIKQQLHVVFLHLHICVTKQHRNRRHCICNLPSRWPGQKMSF